MKNKANKSFKIVIFGVSSISRCGQDLSFTHRPDFSADSWWESGREADDKDEDDIGRCP